VDVTTHRRQPTVRVFALTDVIDSDVFISMMTPTPAGFQILLALVDKPRHGLGIIEEVEQRDGGTLPIGTLYRSLKALVDGGLIEPSAGSRSGGDDPRRRYYRLTAAGRRAVRAEAQRVTRLVAWARTLKLLRPRMSRT
jgi:DNA-binding PadR family transcriptional regulator